MPERKAPEIFFHVGLGKVASKYLQFKVFPRLQGICYIPTGKYKNSKKIIERSIEDKFLISREFDRQLESECKWFSNDFPQAKTIILLRRHDSWIASQYRRFVKNGFPGKFTDFMDIEKDQGEWKKKELLFFEKIKILEKCFQYKPLVLFFDDFKTNPKEFLSKMIHYMDAGIDFDKISYTPKHSSYNEKQLKIMQKLSKKFRLIEDKERKSQFYKSIRRILKMPIRYPILYLAQLLPESCLSKNDLIPSEELQLIRETYAGDWNKCLEYAKRNNP